jgi:hypothetical protein
MTDSIGYGEWSNDTMFPPVCVSAFHLRLSCHEYAAAVALFVVSRKNLGWPRALAGSAIMGTGIAIMHHTGMAAMRANQRAPCGRDDRAVFFLFLFGQRDLDRQAQRATYPSHPKRKSGRPRMARVAGWLSMLGGRRHQNEPAISGLYKNSSRRKANRREFARSLRPLNCLCRASVGIGGA